MTQPRWQSVRRLRRRARLGLVIAAAVLSTACVPAGFPGTRPVPGTGIPGSQGLGTVAGDQASQEARSLAPTLAAKRVAAKEAPATLVADDGTGCLVTAERFRKAVLGKHAWCVWLGR